MNQVRLTTVGKQRPVSTNGGASTPSRDRTVKSKGVVPCPVCKVEATDPCLVIEGPTRGQLKKGGPHQARRVMALRKERTR